MRALHLLLPLLGLGLCGATPAAEPGEKPIPETVSYYKDVRPIFQQHCQGCHQPAKPQGGYIMTSHADLLKDTDRGHPGIVPGKVEKSTAFEILMPDKEGKVRMPKGKDPLAKRDLEILRKWIAQGARDDTPANAHDTVDADHPPIYNLPPVISSLAWSPDGELLAVPGYHEVLLHKGDGSGLVARLIGLAERIQAVAFSPDGKSLAVAGGSPGRFGEIQIWDVEKRKLKVSTSVTFDTLYGVSWSHDSTKVAFGCADNTLRAIDAATGKQVLFGGAHNDWVLGTVFSRDSRYLISISRDRSVKLTEVETQRFIDNITSITPGALKGGLMALARNPNKNEVKVVNTAAGTDKTEKLYDEVVLAGSDGTPRLYKVHRTQKRVIGDDFNKIREYQAMAGRIHALSFNPDGGLFAAGSSLDGKGEVRVYLTADAKVVSRFETPSSGVFAVAYHPQGTVIASGGSDGTIRLSDPATGKLVKEFVPVPLTTAGK
jgi:hypothetical protein